VSVTDVEEAEQRVPAGQRKQVDGGLEAGRSLGIRLADSMIQKAEEVIGK
jgi:hypothetical protein